MNRPITVAVVGLGFGADFVPIYLSHPGVRCVILVDSATDRRRELAAAYGLDDGYDSLEQALADPEIDAVHILTPVYLHADMVVVALEAGKHVACAVPMATDLDDLERIIAAQSRSGCTYMMMETTVFAREFFAVQKMIEREEFGALTLYRGFHIQNLDGFPPYWQGYPPMHYLTHALAPILALEQTSVATVTARGAGMLAERRRTGRFDNPYPAEVGLFTLRDSDVLVDITMAFSQTARSYVEGFSLYGEHRGVEWPIDNEGPLTVFDMTGPASGGRGNRVTTTGFEAPEATDRLPEPLRGFVRPHVVQFDDMPEPVSVPAHHGGSHPYLVHEFVMSILEERLPAIDAHRAAAWTAPGICAHESAMNGGAPVEVPDYEARRSLSSV